VQSNSLGSGLSTPPLYAKSGDFILAAAAGFVGASNGSGAATWGGGGSSLAEPTHNNYAEISLGTYSPTGPQAVSATFTGYSECALMGLVFKPPGETGIVQLGDTQNFKVPDGVNAGTVTTGITVPAGAKIALVGVSGYTNIASGYSGGSLTLTKGGVDTAMTLAAAADASLTFQGALFYLMLPDTGSGKTLKYDFAGSGLSSDDTLFSVKFYSGVDTSGIRTSGGDQGVAPHSVSLASAQAGDLIVAFNSQYADTTNNEVYAATNLGVVENIVIDNSAFSNNANGGDGSWLAFEASGATTVSVDSNNGAFTGSDEGALTAIVLIPA
jgi:hypothetical protein